VTLHEYNAAKELYSADAPFYALIMAAMLKADDRNIAKLRSAWPDIYYELDERYHTPGGLTLPEAIVREGLSS
jgi:hypothetical protein